jgi:hypothetical protein
VGDLTGVSKAPQGNHLEEVVFFREIFAWQPCKFSFGQCTVYECKGWVGLLVERARRMVLRGGGVGIELGREQPNEKQRELTLCHFGVDVAWYNRVYSDTVEAEFLREGRGQAWPSTSLSVGVSPTREVGFKFHIPSWAALEAA